MDVVFHTHKNTSFLIRALKVPNSIYTKAYYINIFIYSLKIIVRIEHHYNLTGITSIIIKNY